MYKGKLGVGIISFDRPQYFGQMITTLAANTHLDNADFHLFQDGAICRFTKRQIAEPNKVLECVSLFNDAKLPNKVLHIRKENVSIAINQFEAFEELTSNYEQVLVLEDDILLSPHYLRLLRVLIEQYKDDDGVFSTNLSFRRNCDPGEIENNLGRVFLARQHWWAECFSSKKWQIIRPDFLRYYELVKNNPYRDRGMRAKEILRLLAEFGFNTSITSQDAAKEAATMHHNLNRVFSVVNRGMYIGEHGIHFRPHTYKNYGFADFVPYVFDSDKDIEEFKR